jgi:hypothetical protein
MKRSFVDASNASSNIQTFARFASRYKLSKTRLSNADTRRRRLDDGSLNTVLESRSCSDVFVAHLVVCSAIVYASS